jgi:hypothetical protein
LFGLRLLIIASSVEASAVEVLGMKNNSAGTIGTSRAKAQTMMFISFGSMGIDKKSAGSDPVFFGRFGFLPGHGSGVLQLSASAND